MVQTLVSTLHLFNKKKIILCSAGTKGHHVGGEGRADQKGREEYRKDVGREGNLSAILHRPP